MAKRKQRKRPRKAARPRALTFSEDIFGDMRPALKPKQRAMLVGLWGSLGNVVHAARAANVAISAHYNWAKTDETYAACLARLEQAIGDMLEHVTAQRAIEGLPRKKFTAKGAPVIDPATGEQYTEREYSDQLAMFRLKACKPDKYRERSEVNTRMEHAGQIVVVELPEIESDGS